MGVRSAGHLPPAPDSPGPGCCILWDGSAYMDCRTSAATQLVGSPSCFRFGAASGVVIQMQKEKHQDFTPIFSGTPSNMYLAPKLNDKSPANSEIFFRPQAK